MFFSFIQHAKFYCKSAGLRASPRFWIQIVKNSRVNSYPMPDNFQEFEIKFVISDIKQFRERLKKLDAVQLKNVIQIDEYLDDDEKSLSARDILLRYRKEFTEHDEFIQGEFSWKGPARGKNIEIREDRSMIFKNLDKMTTFQSIFKKLGFVPFITFKKARERWHLNGFEQEIDLELDKKVWSEDENGRKSFLGGFCQASLETDLDISDEAARTILWKVIESLGYSQDHHEPRTYIELHFLQVNEKGS
ncbi:MAG: class IV adenylate cyclase [Candidatus Helarchaeota archaeon]